MYRTETVVVVCIHDTMDKMSLIDLISRRVYIVADRFECKPFRYAVTSTTITCVATNKIDFILKQLARGRSETVFLWIKAGTTN